MKRLAIYLVAAMSLFASCVNDSVDEKKKLEGSDEKVDPNQDDIDTSGTGDIVFPESSAVSAFSAKTASNEIVQVKGNSTTFPMEKMFTLKSGVFDGMQATDVVYAGSYMLVSYATVGAEYGGGVQIITLDGSVDYKSLTPETAKDHITLADQWVSSDVDINMLEVSGSKVYAVGAVDLSVEKYKSLETSAMLFELELSGSSFAHTDNSIRYNLYPLTSYVGKDVAYANNKVLTVSGDAGYLEVFKTANMTSENAQPIRDARSVKVYNEVAYVLSASGVDKYSTAGEYQSTLVSFESGIEEDYAGAQRILSVSDNCILTPQGIYGVSAYDFNGSELFHLQPASSYEGNTGYDIAVNSAVMVEYEERKFVLVATGEAGLAEAYVNESGKAIYECVFDLDGVSNSSESANMVTSFEMGGSTFVAVATGNDGLHLLRVKLGDEETDVEVPGSGGGIVIDEDAEYEDYYNSNVSYSDLNGETVYIEAPIWGATVTDISNGTVVWDGNLTIKNVTDANIVMADKGILTIGDNANISNSTISGDFILNTGNYNGDLTINGSVASVNNINCQVEVSGDFVLALGNMNGGSIVAGGNVSISNSVNGDITSTGGTVTVGGQNSGTIISSGNVTVGSWNIWGGSGDANGTIIVTSSDASVTVWGSNQNGYIWCPSGKVTIHGSNNSKIYVDAGNVGNLKISGNRGTIIEGQPSN